MSLLNRSEGRRLTAKSEVDPVSKEGILAAYKRMVTARLVDEKMVILVKQNKGGTFQLSATGHEMVGAIAAGALKPGYDWVCPYYREQPLAIGLGCDLVELFGVFLGRQTQHHSRGRMMPYHFSDKHLNIPTQSSVVASQFLPALGIAQGLKALGGDEVVYVSGGDGATSEGAFHEALNYAGMHRLPIVFVIHDNEWAISVPVTEQVAGGAVEEAFANRPGVEAMAVDGGDYVACTEIMKRAVARARSGAGPSLVVAKVPRLAAHSNSDDARRYRDEEALKSDWERDPLARLEKWILAEKIATEATLKELREEAAVKVDAAAQLAMEIPFPPAGSGGDQVFVSTPIQCGIELPESEGEKTVMVDAINEALAEEMERDPSVIVFGEDVARKKGGVFGASRGLTDRFGEERCFNTPLAEATIIGLASGFAMGGKFKPVAEIQFADYLWPGFDQLVSEVSSVHYRSGGEWQVPLVIRMPCGGYIQGGLFHSQSIEGILAHIPGLKIVMPSNASDAKGLLKMAIRDPNPVVFLEHKALYRQAKFCARALPEGDHLVPFGKAKIVREGSDVTLVGWGMMVVMGMEVSAKLAKEGIDVEVVDLRSLVPLDMETVLASVKKTGKLLVAQESPQNCGFSAEVAARIAEEAFEYLDGPVMRVSGLDAPVPYSKPLENDVLPQLEDLELALRNLYQF